jgi:glycerophosphoryl diester phosphodiesterase
MIVAHRGNWREAPENSIWAIKKSIEAGANMAEIDLSLTKDSVLILMHDRTIDRTTTGKGEPSDFTLDEIKKLYLRDGAGHPTKMRIPTLEEVLEVSKGKIFLNLDKGFNYIDLVYPMLKKWDMMNEVLFKGVTTYDEFFSKYNNIKDEIVFMPIIRLEKTEMEKSWQIINDFLKYYDPYGFEFTVGETEEYLIDFSVLRKKGKRVWVNSLWYEHNAGHNDDVALENPNVYDWYIENHVNIIQTDRIKELVYYLQEQGLNK